MKKSTMIGIVILIVIIAVFGYIVLNDVQFNHKSNNGNSNESVEMLSVSKGGVTIDYPSNWVLAQATSNYTILAIAKQNSVDSLEVGQVNIHVEKHDFSGDFANYVNKTYNNVKADKAFELVSSGEVLINDEKALQYIYTSSATNGVVKQHNALWFERGNQAYVIMYSAPVDKYETNLPAAEYIIQHIKIN